MFIIFLLLIFLFAIYIFLLFIFILIAFYKRKTIRELFIKTINFLNKNNITYWVDFGTLLGIHRDRDIILGDNDADICIPSTEEDKLLKAFQNTGSTFKKWRRMHWPAFRTYSFFFVDLYLITFDLEKQMVIIPDSPETPMNLLNSFEETTMYVGKSEITFTQPVEWKKLLVFRYGKKWIEHTNKWYLGYMSFFDTKNPRN